MQGKKMAPKLYMVHASPPVRAVLMTAKALDLELELKEVNLLAKEHFSPEYLKLNPLHTVPTLEDDGFILADSHAIIAYLVEKYGKDDSLYPKDLQKRSVVNSRLYFDCGTIFPRFGRLVRSIIFESNNTVAPEYVESLNEVYGLAERLLEINKWIAGNDLTVADFSVFSTITSADSLVPLDGQKFPKLATFIKKMEEVPASRENKLGLEQFRNIVQSKLSK